MQPKPITVIQTKQSPAMWAVKYGNRFVAHFSGADSQAKAEAEAATWGTYTVRAKTIPPREVKRLEAMAAK